MLCANCGVKPLPPRARSFCGQRCQELAKAIRWARRHGLTEIASDPELMHALHEKLRFIDAGGYRLLHSVSPSTRQQIIESANGRCATCGEPGVHVDHKGPAGGKAYNLPENLQLLCERCHLRKTWGVETYEEWSNLPQSEDLDPDWSALMDEFVRRVDAVEPLNPCDDEIQWKTQRR